MAKQTETLTTRAMTEVPGSSVGGLLLLRAMRRDPLRTLERERREHGPIVRLRGPRTPLFLVTDPAAIKDALTLTHHGYAKGFVRGGKPDGQVVEPLRRALGDGLLTSRPPLHRQQRRLIQPMFHHERVAGYGEAIAALATDHVATWRDGETRDVHQDMAELTLAIVARTVFDVELASSVMQTIRQALGANQTTLRREILPWGRVLDRLPLPATKRWLASRKSFETLIAQLIADRRARGCDGDDLLSLLLSARSETGEPMPDKLVRDEALTLLLAGHETTANALAWALHLLGEHPQLQAQVQVEARTVLGERQPRAGDLPRLPYAQAVISESMRLYPPAWIMVRRLTEEREVSGFRLPAGAALILSPWVVHRDPTWWPEPDRFDPSRWLEIDTDRPAYAYFPFGGGPRQCVGKSFAEMEAALVLVCVCQQVQVSPAPGRPPVRPHALVTLRPRDGVPMTVSR